MNVRRAMGGSCASALLLLLALLVAGCGPGSQQLSCTPTHYQDVSCSVVGMQNPWTLTINGSHVEAVGLFTCDGTWSGNQFKCFTTAGLNSPPEGCEFDITRNLDGSFDTGLTSTGTTAHCTPK